MKRERFLTEVEECLGGGAPPGMLAVDEAARTARAVLHAMGRRLQPAERLALTRELPEGFGFDLQASACDLSGPHELVGEVACELGLDEQTAARRVSCVLAAVRDAIGHELPAALAPSASDGVTKG